MWRMGLTLPAEGGFAGAEWVATHFLRMGMPCAITCSRSLPVPHMA